MTDIIHIFFFNLSIINIYGRFIYLFINTRALAVITLSLSTICCLFTVALALSPELPMGVCMCVH